MSHREEIDLLYGGGDGRSCSIEAFISLSIHYRNGNKSIISLLRGSKPASGEFLVLILNPG